MWNKFDSLDSTTWPQVDKEVLWKITINQIKTKARIHLVGYISIQEGRPTVWDHFLETERHGGYRFLDKDTETVYWMEIEDVEFSPEVTERIESAVIQAEKDIETRKNSDDSFSW